MNTKVSSLLLSSAILLAACGNGTNDKENEKATTEATTEQATTESQVEDTADSNNNDSNVNNRKMAVVPSDVKTSPKDAIKTAQDEAKGELKELSFDDDDNKWVYEVKLKDGTTENKVKVDAETNQVIKTKTENENKQDETFNYADVMNIDDAYNVSKEEFDGKVSEWSLKQDDGILKYEFNLVNDKGEKYEVDLDAKSKKVLKSEQDWKRVLVIIEI